MSSSTGQPLVLQLEAYTIDELRTKLEILAGVAHALPSLEAFARVPTEDQARDALRRGRAASREQSIVLAGELAPAPGCAWS